MAITSFRDVGAAYEAGRSWTGLLKRSGPVSVAGYWQDLTYAAGIPSANFYASTPLISALLAGIDGIQCGPDVEAEGYTKYLHKALVLPPQTSVGAFTMHIHDIVMYYPFIDGDGGAQTMTSSQDNRYDGENCHIMLVSQGAGIASTGLTTIVYIDKDDVSTTVYTQTKHNNPAGTLLTTANTVAPLSIGTAWPYIACPNGCKRIVSFDFDIGAGGIFAAVIVKVLGSVSIFEPYVSATVVGAPVEVDFFRDRLRAIPINDGAYIGAIYSSATAATPTNMLAELTFIWS